MDITFEHPFAPPAGIGDPIRRLARSGVVLALFGSLAVWGVGGALAAGHAPGFVRDSVAVRSHTGTMFSLPALSPGGAVTRYATVSSTGAAASLRLFASVGGTGLDRFLVLTVTRGTGGTDGFVPFGHDTGAGRGVVYRGPLSDFPSTWDEGLDVGGAWASGETHTFRFEIRMSSDPGARGLEARADFRWEARRT